jgi:poly-gamma-glutamate synthesis protein (capsule biosynthesis protein)
VQLIIGGDLVPTQSNIDLFSNGDTNTLFGEELLSLWNASDLRIFNLEVPITDKIDPITKYGPHLIAPTSTIKGIKALNPTLITMANNHILDQGSQGLKSTEDILNRNDIPFIGAGNNLNEANKPYVIQRDGLKIGVYACAEHEFSIATENTPGANPFDPLESLDHIAALKAKCDYVIVLHHGGKEHYRYPSPYLQKVCRKTESAFAMIKCKIRNLSNLQREGFKQLSPFYAANEQIEEIIQRIYDSDSPENVFQQVKKRQYSFCI